MKFSSGQIHDYPVAADATIRVGELVMVNAAGFAVPYTAASNQKVIGVSTQHVNNAGGANGAVTVSVLKRGIVDATIASGASFTQASVGNLVYADGYDTVNQRPTLHSTATGRTAVGTLVSVAGNTLHFVLNSV